TIRANGAIHPANSVTTVPCTSGSISVASSPTVGGNGTTNETLTGSISATFNNCVEDGYTFGGGWTENFNMSITGAPNLSSGNLSITGTVSVPGSTITLSGPGQSGSCAVNVTDTFSITDNNGSVSGAVSYSGSACGQSGSGTVSF